MAGRARVADDAVPHRGPGADRGRSPDTRRGPRPAAGRRRVGRAPRLARLLGCGGGHGARRRGAGSQGRGRPGRRSDLGGRGTGGAARREPVRAGRHETRGRRRSQPGARAPDDADPPAAALPGTGVGCGRRARRHRRGSPALEPRCDGGAGLGHAAGRLVGPRRARLGRLVGVGPGGEHGARTARRRARRAARPQGDERPAVAALRRGGGRVRYRLRPGGARGLRARVRLGWCGVAGLRAARPRCGRARGHHAPRPSLGRSGAVHTRRSAHRAGCRLGAARGRHRGDRIDLAGAGRPPWGGRRTTRRPALRTGRRPGRRGGRGVRVPSTLVDRFDPVPPRCPALRARRARFARLLHRARHGRCRGAGARRRCRRAGRRFGGGRGSSGRDRAPGAGGGRRTGAVAVDPRAPRPGPHACATRSLGRPHRRDRGGGDPLRRRPGAARGAAPPGPALRVAGRCAGRRRCRRRIATRGRRAGDGSAVASSTLRLEQRVQRRRTGRRRRWTVRRSRTRRRSGTR